MEEKIEVGYAPGPAHGIGVFAVTRIQGDAGGGGGEMRMREPDGGFGERDTDG